MEPKPSLKKAVYYDTLFLPASSPSLEWSKTEKVIIKENIEHYSRCPGAFRVSLHPLNLSGKRIVPTLVTQRVVRIYPKKPKSSNGFVKIAVFDNHEKAVLDNDGHPYTMDIYATEVIKEPIVTPGNL